MAICITSDTIIPENTCFRIFAGPGAGKTYWLVKHIQNVLRNSKHLNKTSKIACITYTNVGAETVISRLAMSGKRVIVSTIHSFLYNYIVKPYISFIAKDESFAVDLLKGDDDRLLIDYPTIELIKQKTNQQWVSNDVIIKCIQWSKWQLIDGDLVCRTKFPIRHKGYLIKNETSIAYKKIAWGKGILHYDDILYFSYKLIKKYPFILHVISKEFPYFFIDEFQDTNPIQTEIIKEIAANGTITGVIGDKAQSIYGFLGADVTQFEKFNIPNLQDYELKGNHRSTYNIIKLLNVLRPDFQQKCLTENEGNIPMLIVGDKITCYNECRKILGDVEIHTLAFKNTDSNLMKRLENIEVEDSKLIDNIPDSDYNRRECIRLFIKAIECAKDCSYKESFALMERLGYDSCDSIKIIKDLLDGYETYNNNSLLYFFNYINTRFALNLSRLSKGKAKSFYESHTYQELAICVNNPSDIGFHRTIHKSKGDEFDNVFLIIPEENILKFFLSPNLIEDESQRVYYVAMSRAKLNLFISVPSLSLELEEELRKHKISIDIKRL